MKFNRHGKSTCNTRKIQEEERKRVNTKVNAHQCSYEVYVGKRNKEDVWRIGITNYQHNHPPDPDPFNFIEHRHRDPQCQTALEFGAVMRASKTPYSQAKRTMKESNPWISSNDFYNLEQSLGTHSKEEALRLTLVALAREEFHVRLYEKCVITTHGLEEKTIRTVEHFIFCSGEQIEFAHRFVSGFLL